MTSQSQYLQQHIADQRLDPLTRITRVKESVDDLQILIESARTTLDSPHKHKSSRYKHNEPANNYHIHIDDKDNHSSIDFNISFDARSPIHRFNQWDSSRYQTQTNTKRSFETTNYQTHRKQQPSLPPFHEKQQRSFGQLSNNKSRVVNFRRQPIEEQSIRKHSSPQVYNYAEDDSINTDQYHLSPPPSMPRHSILRDIQKNLDQLEKSPFQSLKLQQSKPELSLEKHVEEMIAQMPPSMSDIPIKGKKTEPIVVPISRMPKNILNYSSKNSGFNKSTNYPSKSKSPQTVKINLNQSMKYRKQQDRFLLQKSRYLNKLKKEEEKSRLSKSRTMSKSRRPLSPSCQQVTNRLYYSRINDQPCPKYQHYLKVLKRKNMKQTVSDYTFVRKYLSEQEIYEVFQQFERQGVPQHKWLIKITDIVYSKLHKWRSY